MLNDILTTLKQNQTRLQQAGVQHAAVFGSAATGRAKPDSDIDILIDLDANRNFSIFDYAGVKQFIQSLLQQKVDIVTRDGLKKGLRDRVLKEAIDAF